MAKARPAASPKSGKPKATPKAKAKAEVKAKSPTKTKGTTPNAQDSPRRSARIRSPAKRYEPNMAALASQVVKRMLPQKQGSPLKQVEAAAASEPFEPKPRAKKAASAEPSKSPSKPPEENPTPKPRGRPRKTAPAESPAKAVVKSKASVAAEEPWTDSPAKKSPAKRKGKKRSTTEPEADLDYADGLEDAEEGARASKRVRQASVGGIRSSIEDHGVAKRKRSPSKGPSRAESNSPARKKANVAIKGRSESPAKNTVKIKSKSPAKPAVPKSPIKPVSTRTRSRSPSTPADGPLDTITVAKRRASRSPSKPPAQSVGRSRSASPSKRAATKVGERWSSGPSKSPGRARSKTPSKPAARSRSISPAKAALASTRAGRAGVTASELQAGLRSVGPPRGRSGNASRRTSAANDTTASSPAPRRPRSSIRTAFGRTPSPAKSRSNSTTRQPTSPSKTLVPEPGRGSIVSSTNPPEIPALKKKNPFYETMPAPTIWHRRMPPFLPFGETPFMERVMSAQIIDDLGRGQDEQAGRDRASTSYFSQASSTVRKLLFGQKAAPEVVPYTSPWELPVVDDHDVAALSASVGMDEGSKRKGSFTQSSSSKQPKRRAKGPALEMSGAL